MVLSERMYHFSLVHNLRKSFVQEAHIDMQIYTGVDVVFLFHYDKTVHVATQVYTCAYSVS